MIRIYYRHIHSDQLKTLETAKVGSWISAVSPTPAELQELADTYKLDHGLLTDGTDLHESPRIESEDGDTYIFTRFCYTEAGRIMTAPLLIVFSTEHIVTVSPRPFQRLDNLTSGRTRVSTTQKTKLMLQILSEVQASYSGQLNAISKTILQIRSLLKKEQISNQDFIKFIDIEETLGDFLSGLVPTSATLRGLLTGRYFKLYEEDRDLIEDLTLGITELIEQTKSRLQTIVNIREAYSTIMANNLNRTFKLLTSITILITIPTIVSSIYGMNVDLPFMHYRHAFWVISAIIAGSMVASAWLFKRNNWF